MPTPRPSARFGALRPSESNPYNKLFEPLKGRSTEAPVKTPKVACGMTIIPADPAIDPKMAIPPPQNRNLSYTMRSIDPPHCSAAR